MCTGQVCITGATGFIGKQLCLYLKNSGCSVFAWDRNAPDKLGNGSDIVHLAARVHQMDERGKDLLEEYRSVNVNLTLKLAQKALAQGMRRFIHVSSVKVYGEKPGYYTENSPTNPEVAYGVSKKEAEDALHQFIEKESGMSCIVLRLPMVYGPGNKGNMQTLLRAAEKKIPLPLGAASGKRSLVSVFNVCSAIHKILVDKKPDRPKFQVYNLTDRQSLTSSELYNNIFTELNGRKGTFYFPESLLRLAGMAGDAANALATRRVVPGGDFISRLFDEYQFASEAFRNDYGWMPAADISSMLTDRQDRSLREWVF